MSPLQASDCGIGCHPVSWSGSPSTAPTVVRTSAGSTAVPYSKPNTDADRVGSPGRTNVTASSCRGSIVVDGVTVVGDGGADDVVVVDGRAVVGSATGTDEEVDGGVVDLAFDVSTVGALTEPEPAPGSSSPHAAITSTVGSTTAASRRT